MTAGGRKNLITFQKTGAPVDDGHTTVPGPWADHCQAWAAIIYGTGQERREAAQIGATQTGTFNVLDCADTRAVNVTDRIVFAGDWDIQSVVPGKDGASLDFTAVRAG